MLSQNVWNCRVAMGRRVRLTSRRRENSRTESIQGTLFPSCPSRRNSHASRGLEKLTVTCLTWATAPGRPVLEPLQPEEVTVPSPWCSFPGLGTTPCLPEQPTLRPFRRKLQPHQAQPQSISTRGGWEHLQMKAVSSPKWVSGTDRCQPSSPLSPRHRHSGSPLPNPSSEKGEIVPSLLLGSQSEMAYRRAQHWNKVIYNQEKGRKLLLLEAASHWSVQLHTAQKSNYTNTLCVGFPIKHVFQ